MKTAQAGSTLSGTFRDPIHLRWLSILRTVVTWQMRGCEIELPGPDVQKMNPLQDFSLNDRNCLGIVCWGNQLQTRHPEARLERHRWVTDDYSPFLSAGETHPEHWVQSCASQYERDTDVPEQTQRRATEMIKGLERLTLLWAEDWTEELSGGSHPASALLRGSGKIQCRPSSITLTQCSR